MTTLDGVEYERAATQLWRWVDADRTDAAVAQYVHDQLAQNKKRRAEPDEHAFLLLAAYAGRCALAALRTGSVDRVTAGFEALAMLDPESEWDDGHIAIAAMLLIYAGRKATPNLKRALRPVLRRCGPELAEMFTEMIEELDDNLSDACGDREIVGPDGPVFVSDVQGAPFEPTTELARAAWRAAELIEQTGYLVGDIGVAPLNPLTWPREPDPRALAVSEQITGCMTVDADQLGAVPDLTVYIAHCTSAATATEAAAMVAANVGHPHIVLTDGPLCLLAYLSFMDASRTVDDTSVLDRLRPGLATILAQWATPSSV
jgi:hypothetical protein